jgi:mono/diheme cytochrome c family protein
MFPRVMFPRLSVLLALLTATPTWAKLTPELAAQLPAPAARPIDFAKDIQPIFEASCVQCHARGKNKGSFSLETRADFLEGGDSGAPAIAGQSAESTVIAMVSGLDPETVMPKKGKKLTREQVAVFRAWIDQGMVWPDTITFFKHEPANLRPNADAAKVAAGARNATPPQDALLERYFAKNHLRMPAPVDDRTYARRVWLDTIGLLPPTADLEAFVADRSPDKRAALVQRLLGDSQAYAEHWLTFWNDLLRNDYKGTGYTDGGRKQITNWLYAALARNLPYNTFVAELINPGVESEGFTKGIIWRGAVNASMVPPMQAAQGISQVFLGVNLKCASCHDSFINEYTLQDSYGLASVYADGPLEIAECDKPTGHIAKVKFLYDDLGAIDSKAAPLDRKQQLAALITGQSNGRLPRTIVNRLWQRFLGYGLVEPVDEMDKPAWSPEIIDWLAEDLVAQGYDLKRTMARILTSRAYQLPSVNLDETTENYVFRGPAVRRLSAEELSDALGRVGGVTRPKLDGKLNRIAALHPEAKALPLQPKWIWGVAGAAEKAPPTTYVFRRTVTLASAPTEATLAITADDNYSVKINGKAAGASGKRNSIYADWLDVKGSLRAGANTIEVTASNLAPDEGRLASVQTDARPDADSPAGLILYARVRAGTTVMDFVSDADWTVREGGKDQGPAVELGGLDLAPWKVGDRLLEVAAAPKDTLPVARVSLVSNDPLMAALGRPNREQIVTVRQATATTLQALELTNGATLATLLRQAADKIVATPAGEAAGLIDSLYLQLVSRHATRAELAVATKVIGAPVKSEGVQDLLWILAMLPEFQLIR